MTKKKDSFWGAGFNLYGLWSKKPIKVYENDWFGDGGEYFDRGGNVSVPKRGFNKKNIYTIGSDDKKDVEDFIYWANNIMKKLKNLCEEELETAKKTENKSFIHASQAVLKLISGATRE